jgi:hypothetical protein
MLVVIQVLVVPVAYEAPPRPLKKLFKGIVSADDIVLQAHRNQGGVEENHQVHSAGIIVENAIHQAGHKRDVAEPPHTKLF